MRLRYFKDNPGQRAANDRDYSYYSNPLGLATNNTNNNNDEANLGVIMIDNKEEHVRDKEDEAEDEEREDNVDALLS